MKQGGHYAWNEPHPRKTSALVIQFIFEFIEIPTEKYSTPMESLCWGRLYCKLSDSAGVLACILDPLAILRAPTEVEQSNANNQFADALFNLQLRGATHLYSLTAEPLDSVEVALLGWFVLNSKKNMQTRLVKKKLIQELTLRFLQATISMFSKAT